MTSSLLLLVAACTVTVLSAGCAVDAPGALDTEDKAEDQAVPPSPERVAVYASDGCRPTGEAAALARTDPSDAFVLARVDVRVGCLGGKWLVGRTIEASTRDVFMGNSSGAECQLWGDDAPKGATFAVVRQRQTAAIFNIQDPCLTRDDGSPLSTDQSMLGIALYRDEAAARAALNVAEAR